MARCWAGGKRHACALSFITHLHRPLLRWPQIGIYQHIVRILCNFWAVLRQPAGSRG